MAIPPPPPPAYPVNLSVEYPDRSLDRLTTAFRIFVAIPIMIVLGTVSGSTWSFYSSRGTVYVVAGAGGLVFLGPLLMILFRQKYPRWWFVYILLMDDRYPSTDQEQGLRLDYVYPDVPRDLNRFLPLVKWLLVIPHFIVLAFLWIAVFFVVIVVWFAILFTGRYPRGIFDFVEGVVRWGQRVVAYAFTLVTDRYPPFSLRP